MVSDSKLENNQCPSGRPSPPAGPANSRGALREQPAGGKHRGRGAGGLRSTGERGSGGDRAGTRWAESPPGARAGKEGHSPSILPHRSFLTAPGIHLPLLLHRNHRSCVGTAPGTIPAGWDVVEGGRGDPPGRRCPHTHGAGFLFQPGCLDRSTQGCCIPRRAEDQTSWFCPVKHYAALGPFSLVFAMSRCCSPQAQQSPQRWVSL